MFLSAMSEQAFDGQLAARDPCRPQHAQHRHAFGAQSFQHALAVVDVMVGEPLDGDGLGGHGFFLSCAARRAALHCLPAWAAPMLALGSGANDLPSFAARIFALASSECFLPTHPRPLLSMSVTFSARVPCHKCSGAMQRGVSQLWQMSKPSSRLP